MSMVQLDHNETNNQDNNIDGNMDIFEGVEKRIELVFNNDMLFASSLRSIPDEDIKDILDAAKCAILVKKINNLFDAYILSESSLFIYDHKIIILTCGTTSLLLSIPIILQKASLLGLSCAACQFTRGDYLFPNKQYIPHTSFKEECDYLNQNVPELKQKFVSDNNKLKEFANSKYVWRTHDYKDDILKFSKTVYYNITLGPNYIHEIRNTLNKYVESYDDYVFNPCGYSLNAYKDSGYITIHVTPQSNCSYVSIEIYNMENINNIFQNAMYNIFHYIPDINISDYDTMFGSKINIVKNNTIVKSY